MTIMKYIPFDVQDDSVEVSPERRAATGGGFCAQKGKLCVGPSP